MKVLHKDDRFHPGMGYQINFFARYNYRQIVKKMESDLGFCANGSVPKIDLKSKSREI